MRHCFKSASLIFRGVSPPPQTSFSRKRKKQAQEGRCIYYNCKTAAAAAAAARPPPPSLYANRSLVLETRDAFGCCETERWIKLLPSSLFVADATTTSSKRDGREGRGGRVASWLRAIFFFCKQHHSKQWFFVCFSATSVLPLKLHFCSIMGGAWAPGFSCLLPNL